MRRIVALMMVAVFTLPAVASAQPEQWVAKVSTKKKSKAKKAAPKSVTPPEAAEEPPPAPAAAPTPPAAPAAPTAAPAAAKPAAARPPSDAPRQVATPADDKKRAGEDPNKALSLTSQPRLDQNRHRYAFVVGGFVGVTAFAFGYWAQGEARRAETIQSADEATRVLDGARKTAATANLLYGLAAATVAYGLVMELLPEKSAEKASMTFHF